MKLGTVSALWGLGGLVLATVSHGAVTISVTSQALMDGSYNYEFSIVNTGPESIATVIIDGPAFDNNIPGTLGAPAGASAVYGAAEGALVFLRGEDLLFDPGTTTAGFTLNSLSPPESGPFQGFEAISTSGADLVGNVEIDGFVDQIFANSFE